MLKSSNFQIVIAPPHFPAPGVFQKACFFLFGQSEVGESTVIYSDLWIADKKNI